MLVCVCVFVTERREKGGGVAQRLVATCARHGTQKSKEGEEDEQKGTRARGRGGHHVRKAATTTTISD